MNLCFLVLGLCIGALLSGITLYCRARLNNVLGIVLKISTLFVLFAFSMLQMSTKGTFAFYGGFTVSLLNLSLVATSVGVLFLELKKIYPFHEKQYKYSGLAFLCVAAFLSFIAMLLTNNTSVNLYSKTNLLILAGIIAISIVFGLCTICVAKKKFAHALSKKSLQLLIFLWSALLFACALISLFVALISTQLSLFVAFGSFVLLVAFVLSSLSDILDENADMTRESISIMFLFVAMLAMQVFVYLV